MTRWSDDVDPEINDAPTQLAGQRQPGAGAAGGSGHGSAAGTGSGGTAPGWYPDPAGGYGTRYYDGTRWTEHASGPAPSPGPGPGSANGYPQQWPPYGPVVPRPPDGSALRPGHVVGFVLGMFVLVMGLTTLPWGDGPNTTLFDLYEAFNDAEDAGADIDDGVSAYVRGGIWMVSAALIVVSALGVFTSGTLRRTTRILISGLVVGLPGMLLLGAVTLVSVGDDSGPNVGRLLIVFGVIAALAVGLAILNVKGIAVLFGGSAIAYHFAIGDDLAPELSDLGIGFWSVAAGIVVLVVTVLFRSRRPAASKISRGGYPPAGYGQPAAAYPLPGGYGQPGGYSHPPAG